MRDGSRDSVFLRHVGDRDRVLTYARPGDVYSQDDATAVEGRHLSAPPAWLERRDQTSGGRWKLQLSQITRRLAGAEADAGRALSAGQPRRRPDPEQPAALHARRHGASGHALPAVPRPADRQQGLGRPALLQRHLRADLRAAVRRALRRPVPGLEARRAVAGAAAAAPGLHRVGGRRHRRRHAIDSRATLAALAFGFGVWLIVGSLSSSRAASASAARRRRILRRLRATPRASLGMTIAHAALGFVVLGAVGTGAWHLELMHTMKPGETRRFRRLSRSRWSGSKTCRAPTTSPSAPPLAVSVGGRPYTVLQPERRLFTVQRRQVAETAIHTNLLRDLYATLGEGEPNTGWVIRLYLQSAGALDLAGRRALRAGRLRLALRPPPPHRRAVAPARSRQPAERRRCSRRLLFLLPLLTLALMAGFFAWSLLAGRDPASIGSVLVGRPAPRLDLPRAARRRSAAHRRAAATGKPVLVNFFASWCTPCLAEHPLFTRLAEREGAAIIGIAWKNKPEEARAWLKRLGDPFKLAGLDLEARPASTGA